MHDVIIIGGGFAGLSSAIYSARYDLKTLLFAREMGGAITDSSQVENYPGFKSISGLELMKKIEEQAKASGAETVQSEIKSIKKDNDHFVVSTGKKDYQSKSVIIASGTRRRKLRAQGAEKFEARGVHYCATCDGAFYRDRTVAVIGGANSAAHAAQLLSKLAKKVYIIYRKGCLRCEPVMKDRLESTDNVEIIYDAEVKELKGDATLSKAVLSNGAELELDGLFVEIGSIPDSALAKQLGVELTPSGEVIADNNCLTNVKGVFAAGDVTNTVLRQGITAAAQGAVAGTSAYAYVTGSAKSKSW